MAQELRQQEQVGELTDAQLDAVAGGVVNELHAAYGTAEWIVSFTWEYLTSFRDPWA
jgi:hypothetical protein